MSFIVRRRIPGALKSLFRSSSELGAMRPAPRHFSAEAPIPRPTADDINTAPIPDHIHGLCSQITSLSLIDAAFLSRALREKLGVSAMPMMAAGAFAGGAAGAAPAAAAGGASAAGAAAAPKKEEKTNFNVKLEKYDAAQKIKLIKELRTVMPDLDLKTAKDMVEGAPKVIKANVPKADAEKIAEKLKSAGGEVVLE